MTRPTLSVLMANYNHRAFLDEALEAIISQSCQPHELIVIDDGSTDGSLDVLQRYEQRVPYMKVFRNDRNRGVIYTANRSLELSKGDYVYWAAADDRLLPGFIQRSMEVLARHPAAGLCCSIPAYFTDDDQAARSNPRAHVTENPGYISPDDLAVLMSRKRFNIAGHTAIVKRSTMARSGGFLPELRWHCDWFALYVAAAREGICFIPEKLAAIRIAQGTYSGGARRWKEQREVVTRLLALLESPSYNDVTAFFRRSGILAGLPGRYGVPGTVLVMLRQPRYWKYLTPRVLRHTFRNVGIAGLLGTRELFGWQR
jgi:glycosyltransferase involved in cell wall biosynthesis